MDDPTGMRLVFDLESDGLLEEVSKVHCIVIKNLDTNEVINLKLNKAMEMLASADSVSYTHLTLPTKRIV